MYIIASPTCLISNWPKLGLNSFKFKWKKPHYIPNWPTLGWSIIDWHFTNTSQTIHWHCKSHYIMKLERFTKYLHSILILSQWSANSPPLVDWHLSAGYEVHHYPGLKSSFVWCHFRLLWLIQSVYQHWWKKWNYSLLYRTGIKPARQGKGLTMHLNMVPYHTCEIVQFAVTIQ